MPDAILSGVRSVVWFAVFALLEGTSWRGPSRTVAISAGLAALLLNLCVSGGIAWPSVAQPLWLLAALAVGGVVPGVDLVTVPATFSAIAAACSCRFCCRLSVTGLFPGEPVHQSHRLGPEPLW